MALSPYSVSNTQHARFARTHAQPRIACAQRRRGIARNILHVAAAAIIMRADNINNDASVARNARNIITLAPLISTDVNIVST